MSTFNDIVSIMKIHDGQNKNNLIMPEIAKVDSLYSENIFKKVPHTLFELNHALSLLGLPVILETDDLETKVKKLSEILPDDETIKRVYTKMEKIEISCDMKEIEFANLHVGNMEKYCNRSVVQLRTRLAGMKNSLRNSACLEKNKDLLDMIGVEKANAFKYFYFLKDESTGTYYKNLVCEALLARDEPWRKVLYKIIIEKECTVERIEEDLRIERVDLLKIIYNFCSKDILNYDRLSDNISIKQL